MLELLTNKYEKLPKISKNIKEKLNIQERVEPHMRPTMSDKEQIFCRVFICKGLNDLSVSSPCTRHTLSPLGQLESTTGRGSIRQSKIHLCPYIHQEISIYLFVHSFHSLIHCPSREQSLKLCYIETPSLPIFWSQVATDGLLVQHLT